MACKDCKHFVVHPKGKRHSYPMACALKIGTLEAPGVREEHGYDCKSFAVRTVLPEPIFSLEEITE